MIEIDPLRVYTVDETRALLCPSKPLCADTVYRMGARGVLQTVKHGPRGGLTGFPGWAILEHINGKRKAS